MNSQQIPLGNITINPARRRIQEETVRELISSIREVGLLNPITVDRAFNLVAGRHRLEACREIGWTFIHAVVIEADPMKAELSEIDENLIRNDLTTLERGEHLARRDEILTELGQRASATQGRPSRGEMISPLQTTAKIAAEIGVTERTAQHEKQIARNITPEVKEVIRHTPMANQKTDLLRLSRLEPMEQRQVVATIERGQAVGVREAQKVVAREELVKTPLEPVFPEGRVELRDNIEHIADGSVDLVFVDPPYNISDDKRVTKVGDLVVPADFDGAGDWDTTEVGEYRAQLLDWVEEWSRVVRPGGAVISFIDRKEVTSLWDAMEESGLIPKAIITWRKRNAAPNGVMRRNLSSATEALLWAVKPGAQYRFNEVPGWDRSTFIETNLITDAEKGLTGHPCQKPINLLTPLIQLTTMPGDLVLDPMAGSGSTGVAAYRLQRRFHLIESDLNHIANIHDRLSKEPK